MELTLYGYWRSSSSYRVRIALELKGLSYTYAPVHLLEGGGQQFSDDYRAKNPLAQVPTLMVSGDGAPFVLAQSVAILEFLDETFPTPALLPGAPRDRARIRQLVEVINSGIQPIANLSVLKYLARAMQQDEGSRNDWIRHWISVGFEAMERLLEQSAGRFAYGDGVTLADCFIVAQVYNASRYQVDLAPYPILRRVSTEAESLPAFLRARPEMQVDAPVQT